MSDRREFIRLVGGAAAWPLTAHAQQSATPAIGFLGTDSPHLRARRLRAFRNGLSEAGYDEGRNVTIEFRWADGQYDRLATLAADLVQRRVSVIVANGPAAVAAKAATTTIPIVFVVGFDPIKLGLVASLNRPGGNLTGVSNLNVELGPKRLELLRELVPAAAIIALLLNPTNPNAETLLRNHQSAARTLDLQLRVVHASTERDFDTAFATLIQMRAGALVIGPDTFFISQSKQLAALTVRHAVPAIFQYREFPVAGGLMS
jgi:putative ABC transport system substrate-binding protein